MDYSLLEKLATTTGLGGLCVGVLLIVFKETLKASFLTKLSGKNSFLVVKYIIWLTWIVAVMGLLAWFTLQALSIQQTQRSSVTTITAPAHSKPKIELQRLSRHLKDHNPDTIVSEATIDIEYVVITGLSDPILERKINSYITDKIGVNEKFDGSEDHEMKITKADIEGDFLNVVAEGYFFGHGAGSAANRVISVNLNLKTGEPVEFKDLFRSGYIKPINQLTVSRLSAQIPDHWFETVTDDQCYYFDSSYLNLCFSEYGVAAGAYGNVTVSIKIEDLRGFVNLNGPLAFAF